MSQLQEMVDGLKDPNTSAAPVAGVAGATGAAGAAPSSDASRSQDAVGAAGVTSGVPASSSAEPRGGIQTAAVATGPHSAQDSTTISRSSAPSDQPVSNYQTAQGTPATAGDGSAGYAPQAAVATGRAAEPASASLPPPQQGATFTRTTSDPNEPSGTHTEAIGAGVPSTTTDVGSGGYSPRTQAAATAGDAAGQGPTSAQVLPSQDATFTRTTSDPNEPSGVHTEAIGVGVVGASAGAAAGAAAAHYGSSHHGSRQDDVDRKQPNYKVEDEVTGKTSGRDLTTQTAPGYNQNQSSSIQNTQGDLQPGGTSDAKQGGGIAPNNGAAREQAHIVSDDHSPIGVNNKDRTPMAGEDLEPQPLTGTYGNPSNYPQIKQEVFRGAQDTDIPGQREAAAANNKTVPAPTITPLKGPVTTSSAAFGGTGTTRLFETQDRNVITHEEALRKNALHHGQPGSQSSPAVAAQQSQAFDSTVTRDPSAGQSPQVSSSAAQQSRAPGVATTAVGSHQYAGSTQTVGSTATNVDSAGNIKSSTGAVVGSTTNNAGGEIGTDAPKKAAVSTDIANGDGLSGVVGLAAKNAGEGVKSGAAGVQNGVTSGVTSARDGVTTGVAGAQSGVTSGASGIQSGATPDFNAARNGVNSGISGAQTGAATGVNTARDGATSSIAGVRSSVTGTADDVRSKLGSGSPSTHAPPAPSQGTAAASAAGLSVPHDKEKRSGSFSKRFSSLGFGKRHSMHDESGHSSTHGGHHHHGTGAAPAAGGETTVAAGQRATVHGVPSATGAQPATATGDFGAGAGSAAPGTIGKASGAQQGSAFTSSTATQGNNASHAGGSDFLNKDPAADQQHGAHVVKKKKSGFLAKLKHVFKH